MWIDSLIGPVGRHKTHARFESRPRNILFCVEKVMFLFLVRVLQFLDSCHRCFITWTWQCPAVGPSVTQSVSCSRRLFLSFTAETTYKRLLKRFVIWCLWVYMDLKVLAGLGIALSGLVNCGPLAATVCWRFSLFELSLYWLYFRGLGWFLIQC